jgi:hypothetical protein
MGEAGMADPGMSDPGMADPGMGDPGANAPGVDEPGMSDGEAPAPPAEDPGIPKRFDDRFRNARALRKAVEAAFAGVDFAELEKAWRETTLKVK